MEQKKALISPGSFMRHAAILAQDDTADEPTERRVDVFNSLASQLEKPFTAKDYNTLKREGLLPMIIQPPGLGQGPGKEPLLWTPREKHILLGLCAIDDWYEERPSPAIRAQILVWLWLYAGDQFNITVNDIQKIMVLWAEKERNPSPKLIQQTCIQLIDKWIGKHAIEGRRALKQELRKVYEAVQTLRGLQRHGRQNNEEALKTLQDAAEIFRHHFKEELHFSKYAYPEDISQIERYMRYLLLTVMSYESCLDRILLPKDSPGSFDKADWHWARYFYHAQWSSWFQPLDVDLTGLVDISVTEWLRNSCLALAQCLMIARASLLTQSLPEHQQPELWRRERGITRTLPFSFSMIDDQSFSCKVNLRISDQEPHTITKAL